MSMLEFEQFERLYSLQTGDTLNGVHFDFALNGPGGATYWLFPPRSMPSQDVELAKAECLRRFDVVGSVRVVRVPDEFYEQIRQRDAQPQADWLAAVRALYVRKTFGKIDPATNDIVPPNKEGGVAVDLYTLSVLLTVHDNLKPANQDRLRRVSIDRAIDVAYQVLNKASIPTSHS